jgi:hypothetical protein
MPAKTHILRQETYTLNTIFRRTGQLFECIHRSIRTKIAKPYRNYRQKRLKSTKLRFIIEVNGQIIESFTLKIVIIRPIKTKITLTIEIIINLRRK